MLERGPGVGWNDLTATGQVESKVAAYTTAKVPRPSSSGMPSGLKVRDIREGSRRGGRMTRGEDGLVVTDGGVNAIAGGDEDRRSERWGRAVAAVCVYQQRVR